MALAQSPGSPPTAILNAAGAEPTLESPLIEIVNGDVVACAAVDCTGAVLPAEPDLVVPAATLDTLRLSKSAKPLQASPIPIFPSLGSLWLGSL